MSLGDAVEFAGWLFACWATGFAMGFVIQTFRKFMEQV